MHKVSICCSGGIDSSALISYYLEQRFDIQAIHFDYGQPAFGEEKKALNAIAKYYKIQVVHKNLRPAISTKSNKSDEFIGRNALFVLSSLSSIDTKSNLISLGIHSGTVYYDCSPVFTQHMQNILDGYFGGTVILDTPFLSFSKADIISWSRSREVPLELTYSCQQGLNVPCGQCDSCVERKKYEL